MPFDLAGSLGRMAMKSAENSTSPLLRLTAFARSTMRWLCTFAMRTEKKTFPVMRS